MADPAYTLEWSQDADFSSITDSTSTNDTTYTFPSGLDDNTWYFRVVATDNAGNSTNSPVSDALIIDTAGPTSLGQPLAAQHVTNDTTPDISWAAAEDKGSGLADPAYKLEWSMDSSFATDVGSLTTNSTSVTLPTSLSTDGKWWLRLTATDNAGNTFITGNSVIIDTTAPTKPVANPAGGTYANTQTILLTSSDNLTNPHIYYTTDGSTPTSSSTQFHDASTPITISSNKTLKAIAYDSVGNVSPIMTETYVITSTTPSAPSKPAPTKTNTTNSAEKTSAHPQVKQLQQKAPRPRRQPKKSHHRQMTKRPHQPSISKTTPIKKTTTAKTPALFSALAGGGYSSSLQ